MKLSTVTEDEQRILRTFFERIVAATPHDSTLSDSPIVKETAKQLKAALRGSDQKCTCHRRRYDICEVCQASDRELVDLRNFFRFIQSAEKWGLGGKEIREFIARVQCALMKE